MIEMWDGRPADACEMLVRAAEQITPADPDRARKMLLHAREAAATSADPTAEARVSWQASNAIATATADPFPADFLGGMAGWLEGDITSTVTRLQDALDHAERRLTHAVCSGRAFRRPQRMPSSLGCASDSGSQSPKAPTSTSSPNGQPCSSTGPSSGRTGSNSSSNSHQPRQRAGSQRSTPLTTTSTTSRSGRSTRPDGRSWTGQRRTSHERSPPAAPSTATTATKPATPRSGWTPTATSSTAPDATSCDYTRRRRSTRSGRSRCTTSPTSTVMPGRP